MQADKLFIYLFPLVNKTMDLAKTKKKQWIWHQKKKKKQWIQAAQETKAPHKGQTGTQQKQKPDGKKLQLKAARAMACNAN